MNLRPFSSPDDTMSGFIPPLAENAFIKLYAHYICKKRICPDRYRYVYNVTELKGRHDAASPDELEQGQAFHVRLLEVVLSQDEPSEAGARYTI